MLQDASDRFSRYLGAMKISVYWTFDCSSRWL